MADRSIKVVLRAEVTAFKQEMAAAASSVQQFSAKSQGYVQKNSASISQLSKTAGLAGAALTGLAVLAVSKAASFDASMSSVQAATMESADNMVLLRQAAIDAGQATVYSASESAGAIESLAKAGVSTKDILGGGLAGALNLASSGAIGVADAADIAATALAQFHLEGSQTSHVADLLAAGANKAQGGVDDLGMALKQSGLVASQTGLSIEETTGGLAAFAKAGLIGSDAGTSFKTMLQRLTPQSDEAKDAMDKLGISAYDSQGNFVGLATFAGNLQGALKNLTPEQRNAAEATIFGSDAVRAASVLYDEGAQGIQGWIDAVNQQGYAAEQAGIRLDNLSGDVEQLKGSLETALIGMGEGAQGPLREMVQSATDVVNAFSSLPGAVQQGTLGIVGGGGLVVLGIAGLGKLVVGISNAKNALKTLEITGKTAGIAMGGIGLAVAAITVGLTAWAGKIADAKARTQAFLETLDADGKATEATLSKINDRLSETNKTWTSGWGSAADSRSAVEMAHDLGIALEDVQQAILGQADAQGRVNAALDGTVASFRAGKGATADQLHSADALRAIINEQAGADSEAEKQAARKALADEAAGVASDGATPKVEQLTAAQQAQAQATEEAQKALDDWRKMVGDADASFIDLGGMYQGLIDKQKEQAQGAADATKSTKDSWEDFTKKFPVTADNYIAELQKQVDAQGAWESNMVDISGRVRDTLGRDMQSAGQQMVDELIKLGPEGAAQVQLLHDMSDEQFATVVSLYKEKGTEAVATFTQQIEASRAPVMPTPTVTPDNQWIQNFLYSQQSYFNAHPLKLTPIWENPGVPTVGSGVRRATGGILPGAPSSSDNMLIAAASGEYIVNARQTAANRPLLDAINSGTVPHYAAGGEVGPGWSATSLPSPRLAGMSGGSTQNVTNNIYEVTDARGTALATTRRLAMLGA